ncbi:MAG: AAA family ATPase [Clostridia bacterium]|nr:AAA family ATPase [Clostridia bacterium]
MKCNVRILDISVKNLKNLNSGNIEFNSRKQVLKGNFGFEKSDIIGIYGQNGSSKSTVINAFSILKKLFSGKALSTELLNYISKTANESGLCISFFIETNSNKYIVDYNVVFTIDEQRVKASIKTESISYKKYSDGAWTKIAPIFIINNEDLANFITPKINYAKLIKDNKEISSQLLVLKGEKSSGNFSFIFSEEFKNIIDNIEEFKECAGFINHIKIYSVHYMHLYDNRDISKITALDTIPFFYKTEDTDTVNSTEGYLTLFNDGKISIKHEETIKEYIKEINIVLEKLIPGVVVGIENLGETLDKDGEKCFKYQFISIKNGFSIPLRLESDGIKKIVSLLSSLVDAFNNPYSILIIDEFDSGIFEYLLGVILDIFKTKGVGQLLFTSHNLRALEIIQDDIIFTTNNPDERFVRIPYVQSSNNLRRKYLRDLFLNETECLSNKIDGYDIYRAFKDAGALCLYGEKK